MPPVSDFERQRREQTRRVVGATISTLTIIALIPVWIIVGLSVGGFGVYIVPCIALLLFAGLFGISWYQWKRDRSRAFALGLLIGIGIAFLMEGLCYVSILRH